MDKNILKKFPGNDSSPPSFNDALDNETNIFESLLNDLISKKLTSYQKNHGLTVKFLKIFYWTFDKFSNLPYLKQRFETHSLESYKYLNISKLLSNQAQKTTNRKFYSYQNSPERELISSKLEVNITSAKDTFKCYQSVSKKIQDHFFKPQLIRSNSTIYYQVAVKNKQHLIKTKKIEKIKGEIYRFILNPLTHFPEILDLLISSEFQKIFNHKHSRLRLAGINLRLSSPSLVESHTTAFHRDYNSYYTVKLFIPLSEIKFPFLEYIPNTELITIAKPHYSPKHIKSVCLPNRFACLSRAYSSTKLSNLRFIPTTCIHRELASNETKITLIVTFLSHPEFGFNRPKANLYDLNSKIKYEWEADYLSFIEPI